MCCLCPSTLRVPYFERQETIPEARRELANGKGRPTPDTGRSSCSNSQIQEGNGRAGKLGGFGSQGVPRPVSFQEVHWMPCLLGMSRWDLGILHGICDTSKMESSVYHGLPKNDLV
jgi:hypothetical protein